MTPPAAPPSHDVPVNANPYQLVNNGLQRHAKDPRDGRSALAVGRAYLALGLYGPAREWLVDAADAVRALPEADALAAELALRKTTARVAWGALVGRYSTHRDQLLKQHPRLASYTSVFDDLPNCCDLFRTADGSFQLSLRRDSREGPRRWLPSLADDRADAALPVLPHEKTPGFCGHYLLLGDRYFHRLRRLRVATADILVGFAPRLFLLEPDPRVFAAGLYLSENVDDLFDPRVSVFVGLDCVEQFAAFLDDHPHVSLPSYLISRPSDDPHLAGRLTATLDRLTRDRQSRALQVIEQARALYDGWSLERWAGRFRGANQAPLRILGLTSRFTTVLQYAMRDVKRAFERLGHAFETLVEPGSHDLFLPESMADAVRRHRPDLIIVIDHHRAEYGRALPENVPYVCWLQDMLPALTERRAGRALGPLDFYVAPSVIELVRDCDYPARQGMVWTLATDPELYSNELLPADTLDPHRCDFSFVSNQSSTPRAFHERMKNAHGAGPRVTSLLDLLYDETLRRLANPDDPDITPSAAQTLNAVLRHAEIGALPEPVREWVIRGYLHPLAELVFRHETLDWIAEVCEARGLTLRLYGRGWEDHPRFARYAAGIAENGAALRAIYQATRFNLQINGYSAIHSRLLDGLASGGFFLIRRTAFDNAGAWIDRALNAKESLRDSPDRARCRAALGLTDGGGGPLTPFERELISELKSAGRKRMAGSVLSHYQDVCFATRSQFEERVDYFSRRPGAMKKIQAQSRAEVIDRFSYDSLVRDLLEVITRRLTEQSR